MYVQFIHALQAAYVVFYQANNNNISNKSARLLYRSCEALKKTRAHARTSGFYFLSPGRQQDVASARVMAKGTATGE